MKKRTFDAVKYPAIREFLQSGIMTETELADRVGMSRQHLNAVLAGRIRMNTETLMDLHRELNGYGITLEALTKKRGGHYEAGETARRVFDGLS